MEEKVFSAIEQFGMLGESNGVIAAVSGGADSVALLHFLLKNRARLGIRLWVAHFDHGLRGEESRRDAFFVEMLCKQYGLACYQSQAHMAEQVRPAGLGTEAWARKLRYEFFDRLAAEKKAVVATAHTLDDNAETVLFHAVRGAGPKGLAGIPPVREPYIRPFLQVTRKEVESYCLQHGLEYVTDSTNADPVFSRNRLRLEAMPVLEQVHPGAAQSLARLAGDMRELDAWLRQQAVALLACAEGGNIQDAARGFDAATLLAAPGPVRRTAFSLLVGPAADRATLDRLQAVLEGRLGAVQLPAPGGEVRLKRGVLCFGIRRQRETAVCYSILLEDALLVPALSLPGGYSLSVSLTEKMHNNDAEQNLSEKSFCFLADYDKISGNASFRVRQSGDRFAPPGRGLSKTLKKWMSEQKTEDRQALPLLAAQNRVLWVWGTGFCEGLQPTAQTRRLLQIQML